MKGCFYLQRRFAYIGHELARQLKERGVVSDFCGYVEQRTSLEFLQNQKDFKYNTLLLDEELVGNYKSEPLDLDYIAELEKKYGRPSLWPFILEDRVIRFSLMIRAYPSDSSLYTHEEMLRMLQSTARGIEKMLDQEKPDFVFFSVISGLGSYLLYAIAKARGIKTFVLYNPRLGERYALSPDPFSYPFLEKAAADMENPSKEDEEYIRAAKKYIAEFREKPFYYLENSGAALHYQKTPITRARHFSFLNPAKFGKSFIWFFKSFYNYFTIPGRADYSAIKPWYEMYDKGMRKLRVLRGYADLYDTVGEKEDYAFYPLQSEPEGLPMLIAPHYATEQVWVIKQMARSLPVHFKLYVKEHPVMVGKRPRAYYEALKKIPNVKLIEPGTSALDLVNHSKLVFCLTSTTGMEAILLNKPVITLADSFFSHVSGVGRVSSVEDLSDMVWEKLYNFSYDQKAIVNFVAAIYKESVPVDLSLLWDIQGAGEIREQENAFKPMVDLIVKKLQV